MNEPLTGGCLCGHIRFELTADPGNPHTCSCGMCRRHTGVLTSLWVELGASSITWTGPGGAPRTYRSSSISSRAFCDQCGSSIGALDDAPADDPVVAILTGALDKPYLEAAKPTGHLYVSERPEWWKPCVE